MDFRPAIARFFLLTGVILISTWTGYAQEKPVKSESQDPPQETIKIGTNLVTVPVVVTDPYGRFARGLTKGDFTVREDGITQKIESFSSEEAPFDVALLIDTSRSTQNKLVTIRKAALAFFKQLQPRDRVMIVAFDERVRFINNFTNDSSELEQAVKTLKSNYLTSLYDAIHLTVTEKLANAKGRKAIVVLTDGVDTASKQATFESTLELIASTGIVAYAIQYETRNDGAPIMKPIFLPNGGANGFTSRFAPQQPTRPAPRPDQQETSRPPQSIINLPAPGTGGPTSTPGSRPSTRIGTQSRQTIRDRYLIAADFMRSLAVQSGARYIRAENIENTSFAFQLIAEELRYQYTLSYISSNEKRDGNYRSIQVGVGRDGLLVRARLGYWPPRETPISRP